ncbi:hypothetical protein D3C75_914530 [compost metagenome]
MNHLLSFNPLGQSGVLRLNIIEVLFILILAQQCANHLIDEFLNLLGIHSTGVPFSTSLLGQFLQIQFYKLANHCFRKRQEWNGRYFDIHLLRRHDHRNCE